MRSDNYPTWHKFQNNSCYMHVDYIHVIDNKKRFFMCLQSIIVAKLRPTDNLVISFRPSSSNHIYTEQTAIELLTKHHTGGERFGQNDSIKKEIKLNFWIRPDEKIEFFVKNLPSNNVEIQNETTSYIIIPKLRVYEL